MTPLVRPIVTKWPRHNLLDPKMYHQGLVALVHMRQST
jgi:hypothetical protein